jgi:hypothetical protein
VEEKEDARQFGTDNLIAVLKARAEWARRMKDIN